MSMKLNEALALRADTQKRVMQLRERLRTSALVQEGEAPPEDPRELLAELDRLLGQLTDLVGVRPIASSPSGEGAALIKQRSCVRFAPRLPGAMWRSDRRAWERPDGVCSG